MAPKPGKRDEAFSPSTAVLVENYYKLATKITWDFIRSMPHGSHDPDDLLSVGTWALVDSALRWPHYCFENSYDPNANYFHAFLMQKVKGALLDYCRSEDYVTREIRELTKKINQLKLQGFSRSTILVELKISDDEYSSSLAAVANNPRSTTELLEDSLMGDPESVIDANFLLSSFADIVQSLPMKQQAIIALKYYAEMDLPTIATVLGMPDSAVQKLHTQTILLIKEKMEEIAKSMGNWQGVADRYQLKGHRTGV